MARRPKPIRQPKRSSRTADILTLLNAVRSLLIAASLIKAAIKGQLGVTVHQHKVTKVALYVEITGLNLDGATVDPGPATPGQSAPSPIESLLLAIGWCVARLVCGSRIGYGEIQLPFKNGVFDQWHIVHSPLTDETDDAGWTVFGE